MGYVSQTLFLVARTGRVLLLGILPLIAVGCSSEVIDEVSIPTGSARVERGFTLVTGLAGCASCHGAVSGDAPGALADPLSPLTGGRACQDRYGEVLAPNLTPAQEALKDWTSQDIIKLIS